MTVNQVKTLFLDDGITVSPPSNVMTSAGSLVSYASDAAFVTGKGSAAADGDIYYNTTDDVIRYYSDGAWSTIIDNDSTQNMSGKTVTDNMNFSSTGAINIPKGTTAQRPSPTAGDIRYNTSLSTFEGYTDKWGSIGGGATPVAIDHTTTSLSVNNFYIIDMGGAGGNVTFTFPDMVTGDQFKALVYNNGTNGYLATFQTTTPQNMRYRGDTDTSIQLTLPDTWVGGAWDNNDSVIAIYDASTFLSGTLAGDWNVEGDLTVDTDTLFVDSTNGRVGIGTATPARDIDIVKDGNIEMRFVCADAGSSSIVFGDATDNAEVSINYDSNTQALKFNGYNNTPRMTIDSSGNSIFNGKILAGGVTSSTYSVDFGVDGTLKNAHHSLRRDGFWAYYDVLGGSGTSERLYFGSASTLTIYKPGGGSFADSSDIRLKKNITPYSGALDLVKNIDIIEYDWDTEKRKDYPRQIGFSAQQLKAVMPHWVQEGGPDEEITNGDIIKDTLSISLGNDSTAIMIKAIQEQQSLIDKLTARIEKLEGGL